MEYTEEQLIHLFGTGFENIFKGRPRQEYSARCTELLKALEILRSDLTHMLTKGSEMRNYFNLFITKADFQQIMDAALARTALTTDAVFGEGHARLMSALNLLLNDLEEVGTTFTLTTVTFEDPADEYKAVLKEYVRISEHLRETDEVRDLEAKMRELAVVSVRKLYGPFVFVCSSSGTGKTNMAFSLNIPFLYFLYSLTADQFVYQCFRKQSECLSKYIRQDYAQFASASSNTELAVNADTVSSSKLSFMSVGFLVEFITRLMDLIEAFPEINPAELQLSIRSLSFKAMTIEEGRLALRTLFGSDYYLFPITFDECSIEIPISGSEDALRFAFLPSLVRCLLCTPIFMGTNAAEAANFRGMSTESGSRSDGTTCWCLVWHRSPGVPIELMTQEFLKIRETLASWKELTHSNFPSDSLLDFLEECLLKERPLFLVHTQRFIQSFCTTESTCSSDEDFMAQLTKAVGSFNNSNSKRRKGPCKPQYSMLLR